MLHSDGFDVMITVGHLRQEIFGDSIDHEDTGKRKTEKRRTTRAHTSHTTSQVLWSQATALKQ